VGSHPCGGREAGGHPAQHFSGRGLNDRNSTLWASFVIEQRELRIFFSGDSGYFPASRKSARNTGRSI
jgi:L-ascorbate metabolism protein UlaG (beta-lactamase superfamily)